LKLPQRKLERKIRLAEEKGEKAKIFGTLAEAQWKKGNTLLASTSEKHLESATLDAVSLFPWSRTGMTPKRETQESGAFSPFSSPPQ